MDNDAICSLHHQWGVLVDRKVHALSALSTGTPILSKIGDSNYRQTIRRKVENETLPVLDRETISLLAPIAKPGKIICAGMNYHDHADEQNENVPEDPLLFAKAPTAVTNPDSPIVHPTAVEEVDYEVELGVVVGRTGRRIDAGEADNYVAGYTVVNDVSARDAQFSDDQFFRGKSYDTFSPMGPTLVAGDSFDPNAVDIKLSVNGNVKQSSNTQEFIFDVGELISYISGVMTLHPGDVISTGTPGGVGIFRDPPELLEPGDVIEAEIEDIGTLENAVVAE